MLSNCPLKDEYLDNSGCLCFSFPDVNEDLYKNMILFYPSFYLNLKFISTSVAFFSFLRNLEIGPKCICQSNLRPWDCAVRYRYAPLLGLDYVHRGACTSRVREQSWNLQAHLFLQLAVADTSLLNSLSELQIAKRINFLTF